MNGVNTFGNKIILFVRTVFFFFLNAKRTKYLHENGNEQYPAYVRHTKNVFICFLWLDVIKWWSTSFHNILNLTLKNNSISIMKLTKRKKNNTSLNSHQSTALHWIQQLIPYLVPRSENNPHHQSLCHLNLNEFVAFPFFQTFLMISSAAPANLMQRLPFLFVGWHLWSVEIERMKNVLNCLIDFIPLVQCSLIEQRTNICGLFCAMLLWAWWINQKKN